MVQTFAEGTLSMKIHTRCSSGRSTNNSSPRRKLVRGGGGVFTRPVTTRMTTLRWQQCEQFCCYSVLHSSRRANPWTGEQKGKQKWIQKWVRLRTCKVLYHKVKSSWQLPVWQVYLQQLIMLEVQGGLTFLSDGADYKHTLLSSSPLLCVVHHCAQFESDCMHNISV